MVSNLTVRKPGYEEVQEKVKDIAQTAQFLKDKLLNAVDLDTVAFNRVMDAIRMSKNTDEQKVARDAALEEGSKEATLVPLDILEKCIEALELAKQVALHGNKNSISDAGVAGLTAQAGAEGAYYNVKINLPSIQDEKFKKDVGDKAESLVKKACQLGNEIKEMVLKELS